MAVAAVLASSSVMHALRNRSAGAAMPPQHQCMVTQQLLPRSCPAPHAALQPAAADGSQLASGCPVYCAAVTPSWNWVSLRLTTCAGGGCMAALDHAGSLFRVRLAPLAPDPCFSHG